MINPRVFNGVPSLGEDELWPKLGSTPGDIALPDTDSFCDTELLSLSNLRTGWRNGELTTLGGFNYMLNDTEQYKQYHDAKIEVGVGLQKKDFTAHRFLLALKCSFFYKEFNPPGSKKRVFHLVEMPVRVALPKLDPIAFERLLHYVYTGNFNPEKLQADELFAVFKTAKECGCNELITACSAYLRCRIDNRNVSSVYQNACDQKDERLMTITFDYISRNANEVFSSQEFLTLSEDALCNLLDNDDLCIDESLVFDSVKRWAQAKLNSNESASTTTSSDATTGINPLRKAMGEAFLKIRFPLMKVDDVFKIRENEEMFFSDEEFRQLCAFFLRDKLSARAPQTSSFNSNSRKRLHEEYEDPHKPSSTTGGPGENQPKSIKLERFETVQKSNTEDEGNAVVGQLETNANSEIASTSTTNTTAEVNGKSDNQEVEASPRKKKIKISLSSVPSPAHSVVSSIVSESPSNAKNLNHLISTISRDEKSEIVSSINDSVELTVIPYERIYLPKLTEFKLNFTARRKPLYGTLLKSYIKDKTSKLKNLLFFNKTKDSTSSNIFQELFDHRVNVSIVIYDIRILIIDHDEGLLVMNLIKDAQEIVDSATNFPLKKLAVSECELTSLDPIRRDLLQVLVLRKVKGLKNNSQLVKTFTCLTQLCWNDFGSEDLNLFTDLLDNNQHVSKLSLAKCNIRLPPRISPTADISTRRENLLTKLYLDNCIWPPEFVSSLPFLFPYVKRIHFYGKKCDTNLLYYALQMSSIQWIFAWDVVYIFTKVDRNKKAALTEFSQKMEEFLKGVFDFKYATAVQDKPLTFILEKKSGDEALPSTSSSALNNRELQSFLDHNKWQGTKLSRDKFRTVSELDFGHHSYDEFYKNYTEYRWSETSSEKEAQKLQKQCQDQEVEVAENNEETAAMDTN